jgi:hypothetical protein|eukprot:COSAG06_NODE_414_length_16033_cov_67.366717_15_plen_67_part_00
MNARLIGRGVPSCPTECHCDAASRCGTPYTNETVPPKEKDSKKPDIDILSKAELFALRPGRPLRLP